MPKFAWLASHESYQPEVLIDQAVLAEQAGFDMVTASDHFHPWVDDNSAAGFVWTWLGAAAARTDSLDVCHIGDVPAIPLPPCLDRPGGGDGRSPVGREIRPRRRHRREHQRGTLGL